MRCDKNVEFVITVGSYIEMRKKDGTFVNSICCRKCVKDLKKKIKEFEKLIKKKK